MDIVIKGVFPFLLICSYFTPLNGNEKSFFPTQYSFQSKEEKKHFFCFFIPPKNWGLADPKFLAPSVHIGFVANKKNGFCPSINLSSEEVNVSIQEYLKVVKGLYEADRDNRWRELGKIKTQAGDAYLTEIDTQTEWGAVRLLQLILLKEGKAYILTAGALKEEFSHYYKDFQNAFISLKITTDLISELKEEPRQLSLRTQFETLQRVLKLHLKDFPSSEKAFYHADFQKKTWTPFQQSIVEHYADMGAYWQVLLLKNFQKQLLALQPESKSDKP